MKQNLTIFNRICEFSLPVLATPKIVHVMGLIMQLLQECKVTKEYFIFSIKARDKNGKFLRHFPNCSSDIKPYHFFTFLGRNSFRKQHRQFISSDMIEKKSSVCNNSTWARVYFLLAFNNLFGTKREANIGVWYDRGEDKKILPDIFFLVSKKCYCFSRVGRIDTCFQGLNWADFFGDERERDSLFLCPKLPVPPVSCPKIGPSVSLSLWSLDHGNWLTVAQVLSLSFIYPAQTKPKWPFHLLASQPARTLPKRERTQANRLKIQGATAL